MAGLKKRNNNRQRGLPGLSCAGHTQWECPRTFRYWDWTDASEGGSLGNMKIWQFPERRVQLGLKFVPVSKYSWEVWLPLEVTKMNLKSGLPEIPRCRFCHKDWDGSFELLRAAELASLSLMSLLICFYQCLCSCTFDCSLILMFKYSFLRPPSFKIALFYFYF